MTRPSLGIAMPNCFVTLCAEGMKELILMRLYLVILPMPNYTHTNIISWQRDKNKKFSDGQCDQWALHSPKYFSTYRYDKYTKNLWNEYTLISKRAFT